MAKSITSNLASWDPEDAVRAAVDVAAIQDHGGLDAILRAVESREAELVGHLLASPPTEQTAVKERKIGEIQGVRQIPLIIAGIVENGRKAEHRLRQQEEQ